MKRMRRVIMLVFMAVMAIEGACQSFVRTLVFVSMDEGIESRLDSCGARLIDSRGGVGIVDVRVDSMQALGVGYSYDSALRLNRHTKPCLDSIQGMSNVSAAYYGQHLPSAFRGRGVVMGIMDVGFDLSNPTFLDASGDSRFKAFWDMLDTTSISISTRENTGVSTATMPVGRAYEGDELAEITHSTDSHLQFHAAHTLGIAAGNGADTPYRGIAPESEICAVNNAVSSDLPLIDSTMYYMYTSATDALGFKYIFDYAKSVGKPCVINFSEGSLEDFQGYDKLYYEILDSLTGPGRIIVASAGNTGYIPRYAHKPADRQRASADFANADDKRGYLTLKGEGEYRVRLTFKGGGKRTERAYSVDSLLATADSTLRDSIEINNEKIMILATAYPSCYNADDRCLDINLTTTQMALGVATRLSVGMEGNTDVSLYALNGYLMQAGEGQTAHIDKSHSINSPGSAPSVVCVGANSYRTGFVNYEGETMSYPNGTNGELAPYSSTGPTFDERMKPDVVAPGTNVISSYSSFYWEGSGEKGDRKSITNLFDYDGRTFLWAANTGTSMSAPVVTGAIALWLQAKPDLTPKQVADVLAHTSTPIDSGREYPNNSHGHGQIDVYKGLLYILGTLGISGVSDHQPAEVSLRAKGEGVEIRFASPLTRPAKASVYDPSGKLLFSQELTGDGFVSLPRGLSIVQVDGPNAATTGSTIIRR